jgi:hypothetical protein
LKLGTGVALGGALAACGGSASDNPVSTPVVVPPPQSRTVAGWTEAALDAVRVVKPGPPMAARSFAIMHTCMFNAWAAYDPNARATPHGPVIKRPAREQTAANKAVAMSYAAYTALVDQFPTQKAAFDSYMKSLGYDPAVASTDAATPAGVGTLLGRSMLDFCHADGSNQLGDMASGAAPYADYTGYSPRNPPMALASPTPLASIPEPGRWQPLSYADATGTLRTPSYLAACWDHVKPFALSSPSQFRPGPPAAFGSAEYEAQARRIVDVTQGLTDEQKVIAEYWADGPNSELPPGHWLLFGLFISNRDAHTDDDDVKMFFALSNALSDAAIAAWDAKRAYDSERPITAIRYLMHGQAITGYGLQGVAGGLSQIQGEEWAPFQPSTFPTPPFPEHVSGHSTFSAAAAEVLRSFTGSDAFGASFTKKARSMAIDPTLPANDVTLAWATFSDAAAEAGISRIYGGIHFDKANVDGQSLGRKVGAQVYAAAQGYWEGTS